MVGGESGAGPAEAGVQQEAATQSPEYAGPRCLLPSSSSLALSVLGPGVQSQDSAAESPHRGPWLSPPTSLGGLP